MRLFEVRRVTGAEALLWAAAIAVPLVLLARAPRRAEVVDVWLEAVARGDMAAAESLLAPDPVLESPFTGKYLGVAAARGALEWRRATGVRLEVERVLERDEADGRLALLVRERSRALDLLGVRPRYQVHYYVRGGRIATEMTIPHDRRLDAEVRDSLAAFAGWLDGNRPGEREALFVDGRPRWTGQTAERWLARLEEWRAGRP